MAVNEKPSTRSAIVESLRREGGYVPGTRLCEELGVSRVAVWKQVEALRAAGYRIESERKGYRLVQDLDSIQGWEFPDYESRIVHYAQTDSTMDRALELALAGGAREWIVLAESQRKGRGRRGRTWKSEPGGLFCSLVVYPGLALADFALPLMAAGVALCQAVREATGEEAWLEWPNDLYLGGRKLAGILPEFLSSGETIRFMALGLGVNVDNRVGEGATSLRAASGKRVSRKELLRLFLERFEPMKESGYGGEGLGELWWSLSSSQGRAALDEEGNRIGHAKGIARDGSLLVETGRGNVRAYGLGKAALTDKEKKK